MPEVASADERRATADFLAALADADPDADPLGAVEERGGYGLGCAHDSNPASMTVARRADL